MRNTLCGRPSGGSPRLTAPRLGAVITLGAVLALTGTTPGPGRAQEARPAVLFVSHGLPQLRTWEDWLQSGFEVDAREISAVRTVEDLHPFNVVVMNSLPPVDGQGLPHPSQLPLEEALAAFLQEGGGVLAFCPGSGFSNTNLALTHLLRPYGAEVPEEQVTDPEHIFGPLGDYPMGCYTTQIEPGPMTQGVTRLGYLGQASRADCIEMTMPITFPDPAGWHVVVRGEETAYSAEGLHPGSGAELKDEPASYASSPVLAAWREVGPGRLFVFPHNPSFTTSSPEVFLNVLWNRHDQTEPGALQNRTLIMQAVRWAAEPTLAGGQFGGFVADRSLRPDDHAILKPPEAPIDWTQVGSGERLAPRMYAQRGLIGARSTYSGGRHTVAELCQAARAAGLQFLGFTEDLHRLTPALWARLQQECAAESGDDFLALPGLLGLDKEGNTWFGLGWPAFPEPPALTPDLQRLDNTYYMFDRVFRGRLFGFARVGTNPNPWFEMKQASAFAVYTRETDGSLDDMTETYLHSSRDMENYLPFAVTLVETPEALAELAAGSVNVFTGPSVAALEDYARGRGDYERALYWASPHLWYVSSGPELVYHGGYNLGNLAVDEELQNLYRYGFMLRGLQPGDRVLLYDGTEVLREWRAAGETFSTEYTWPHDQVRQLALWVVRDGELLLLSSPVTLHYGRRFMQCGDRQNTLPFNYQPDFEGRTYVSGIPLHAHYRSWPPRTLVYGNFKIWLTGATFVEYQPPMYMSFDTAPLIPFAGERKEPGGSLASYHHHRLSCPGILIVDGITDRVYPDGGRHTGDCTPPKLTEPTQLFTLEQRRYAIYGMLEQLNGQFVESKITALQDSPLEADPARVMVSRLAFPLEERSGKYAEIRVGEETQRHALGELPTLHRDDPLAPGDYVGMYPHGLARGGAHYAVRGDLLSNLATWQQQSIISRIDLQTPGTWQAGDTFSYDMLFTTGGSEPHEPRSRYAQVADFLNLRGGGFSALVEIEGGRLLDEPVIATLEVEPETTLRLATRLDRDDPIGLPFRLRGFEPNWQVVYTLNDSPTWRYCGQFEGAQYFHLYTNMDAYRVKLGHPLLADHTDVRVRLDDPAGRQGAFEVYNPSAEAVTVNLRANPDFLPAQTLQVRLAPYESRRVEVRTAD